MIESGPDGINENGIIYVESGDRKKVVGKQAKNCLMPRKMEDEGQSSTFAKNAGITTELTMPTRNFV